MPVGNKITGLLEGRHARLVIIQDQVPKSFLFKNWTIKPNVTKHNDGIGGEQRDELSKTLNFYEMSGSMFVRDLVWLDAWLEAQEAEDAMTAPIDQEAAWRMNMGDGTRQSYILDEFIWDDWEFTQGGRAEKIMVPTSFRFKDLKKAKSL